MEEAGRGVEKVVDDRLTSTFHFDVTFWVFGNWVYFSTTLLNCPSSTLVHLYGHSTSDSGTTYNGIPTAYYWPQSNIGGRDEAR